MKTLLSGIRNTFKPPVRHPNGLTVEQMHDWVNITPRPPAGRIWDILKPMLIKGLFNLLWTLVLVAICYAAFRAMDYSAIEDGCLRYELQPTEMSDRWEQVCGD